MKIDADGLHYKELNERIHAAIDGGDREIALAHVLGQRYIGAGLNCSTQITIDGVPGNDLGAFMNGAEITVRSNAQDGVGNTMNAGRIVIHGHAGDILGHSMRGGRIYVKSDAGYRAGIHMKAYRDHFPVVIIGGTAGDYLGEYMAGGVLAVLGIGCDEGSPVGEYVGTGMHGGVIYIRGCVEGFQLGREAGVDALDDDDWETLSALIDEYGRDLAVDVSTLRRDDFIKLTPTSTRPYGNLYAY